MRDLAALAVALLAVIAYGATPASASHQGTPDQDCSNFGSQALSQDYFEAHGGPSQDPDQLDSDGDGVACESNPCPCRGPGQSPSAPPLDGDGDGRSDDSDACPTHYALTENGCPPPPPPPDQRVSAVIVRVIDGDTVLARTDRGEVTVRLIGIDTPETKKRGTPIECGGREATRVMRRFARVGERVTLATDATQDTFDRFGRLLA